MLPDIMSRDYKRKVSSMHHRNHVTFMIVLVLITSVGGTGLLPLQAQDQTNKSQEPKLEAHAYFDALAKWENSSIPVCWENPTSVYKGEIDMVRKAVASTWEAASALRFTGWQKCVENNRGIRILIDD